MMKQHIFTLLFTLLFAQAGITQSTGTFTDTRDGQTYKTISFENTKTGTTIVWLAQNLNYKVQDSYAYNDDESNRKEFGLLYTWEAAKKACPKGWHLASDSEWSMLVNKFGGTDKAGKALKSEKSWNENGNGTNSSEFNGLAGGQRTPNGSYRILGFLGYWWSSTPTYEMDKAWAWNLHYGGPASVKPLKSNKSKVFRFDADILSAISVRCVRD